MDISNYGGQIVVLEIDNQNFPNSGPWVILEDSEVHSVTDMVGRFERVLFIYLFSITTRGFDSLTAPLTSPIS